MNRPILNPSLHPGEAPPAPRKRSFFRSLFRIFPFFYRVMTTDLLGREAPLKIEDAPWMIRTLRAIFYRALLAPILLVALSSTLVYIGTHPPKPPLAIDPLSQGVYYDPVSYMSDDGTPLEGWLIPTLDEKLVIEKRDDLIRQRRPAVVMVHDFGATRTQMVPLIQPFHNAGYVVLVVSLRGSTAAGPGGQGSTFGLREVQDISGALDMLRRRPEIDPQRIVLMGYGTGANAVLLAAEREPNIAGLILDHPYRDVDVLVQKHLIPPQPYLRWMAPICKWTFELGYQVDAEDLDFDRHEITLKTIPHLLLEEGTPNCFQKSSQRQATAFMDKAIGDKATAAIDPK